MYIIICHFVLNELYSKSTVRFLIYLFFYNKYYLVINAVMIGNVIIVNKFSRKQRYKFNCLLNYMYYNSDSSV